MKICFFAFSDPAQKIGKEEITPIGAAENRERIGIRAAKHQSRRQRITVETVLFASRTAAARCY
jgi:hypothetical protein